MSIFRLINEYELINMNICHEQSDTGERAGGRFVGNLPDGSQAYVRYRLSDKMIMVIDSTFVPPEHRGGRLALELTEFAIATARDKDLKIIPQCPYTAKLFKRRQDWADLLA